VDGLWATKSEGIGLINCAVSFQDFQPVGYLYSAQCKWRSRENNRFRVKNRVRDWDRVRVRLFSPLRHLHCAECRKPNLCDPDPPTLQADRRTDGWTDDMQSQYRALHYSASRGKNYCHRTPLYTIVGPFPLTVD